MAPKSKLKECPLFSSDSSTPHSKVKAKKTKNSSSISRTIVNCFPSASATDTAADLSPPNEPVRVPRNPLVRSTFGPRPPCTRDVTPKKKRVTFCLPDDLPPQRVFISHSSSSLPVTVPTQAPSSSNSIQCSSSSSSLPFGQSLSFSTVSSPDAPFTSVAQPVESLVPTGMFHFIL